MTLVVQPVQSWALQVYGSGRLVIQGSYGLQRISLNGVKIQRNGKIVAVGGGDFDFDEPKTTPIAVRILSNGTMDGTFRLNGMGRYLPQADVRNGSLEALALTPITGQLILDQSFVAVGKLETGADTGLYNGYVISALSNGVPDQSFGTSAEFIDTIGDTLSFTDVEREGDGGLVAVGTVLPIANSIFGLDFYATRILANGTRDVFGFNYPFGHVMVDFGFSGKNDTASAAAFQSDRILIAGGSLRSTSVPIDFDFSVAALLRQVIFSDSLE